MVHSDLVHNRRLKSRIQRVVVMSLVTAVIGFVLIGLSFVMYSRNYIIPQQEYTVNNYFAFFSLGSMGLIMLSIPFFGYFGATSRNTCLLRCHYLLNAGLTFLCLILAICFYVPGTGLSQSLDLADPTEWDVINYLYALVSGIILILFLVNTWFSWVLLKTPHWISQTKNGSTTEITTDLGERGGSMLMAPKGKSPTNKS